MWLHLPFSRSSENVQHCFTRKVTPLFLSALKTLVALSTEHAYSLISNYSMWTIEHTGFLKSLGRVFKLLEQKLFVWYKLGELKIVSVDFYQVADAISSNLSKGCQKFWEDFFKLYSQSTFTVLLPFQPMHWPLWTHYNYTTNLVK